MLVVVTLLRGIVTLMKCYAITATAMSIVAPPARPPARPPVRAAPYARRARAPRACRHAAAPRACYAAHGVRSAAPCAIRACHVYSMRAPFAREVHVYARKAAAKWRYAYRQDERDVGMRCSSRREYGAFTRVYTRGGESVAGVYQHVACCGSSALLSLPRAYAVRAALGDSRRGVIRSVVAAARIR